MTPAPVRPRSWVKRQLLVLAYLMLMAGTLFYGLTGEIDRAQTCLLMLIVLQLAEADVRRRDGDR